MEQQVQQFAQEGKWLGVVFLFALYFTRLFKPDSKLPWNIDSRWIPFFAIFVATVAGLSERMIAVVQRGAPVTWDEVRVGLINGVTTGVLAFVTHHLTFNGLFPKSDLPLPRFLLVPGASPAPGKPPSIPPEDMTEKEKRDLPS